MIWCRCKLIIGDDMIIKCKECGKELKYKEKDLAVKCSECYTITPINIISPVIGRPNVPK